MIQVMGIDHVVLIAADVERTVQWYADKLGLVPERLAEWREGTVRFASMRISPTTIVDVFSGNRTGVNVDHLSFVVDPGADLHALAVSGDFDVEHEPFVIWGAQGDGWAVYVRDPDGNRVELKQYAVG